MTCRMQGLLSPPSQAQLSGELLKENQELRAKVKTKKGCAMAVLPLRC